MLPSPAQPRHWIVAILPEGNSKPVGIGFLVGRRHILTCAHVVNVALGLNKHRQDRPNSKVWVEFPLLKQKRKQTAHVDQWRPPKEPDQATADDDIAVLELDGHPPAKAEAATLGDQEDSSEIKLYGFPPEKWPGGGWVSGRTQGKLSNGLIQIDCAANAALTAQSGFSGGPVYERATHRCVGMLVQASNSGGRHDCRAIPASKLQEAFPLVFVMPQRRRKLAFFILLVAASVLALGASLAVPLWPRLSTGDNPHAGCISLRGQAPTYGAAATVSTAAAIRPAGSTETTAEQTEETGEFAQRGWHVTKRFDNKYRATNGTNKAAYSVRVSGELIQKRNPNDFIPPDSYIDFESCGAHAEAVTIRWWTNQDEDGPPFQERFHLP